MTATQITDGPLFENEESADDIELSKKMRGTRLELEFALACIKRGFVPSMTVGDDAHYDVVVEKNGQYARVNLKMAAPKGRGPKYPVNISRKVPKEGKSVSVQYQEGQLDIIATKIDDEWFFFNEVHTMPGSVDITHSSTNKTCKWNSGREAWNRLGLDS